MKSVREGKVVNPDVSKQGVAHCLVAGFLEATDDEKCDYVKVLVFLPFSDLEQMIWARKKNKNIHSEALLKLIDHDAMALISELIAMKMRKVMWLLAEGRKRPCWGVMMAILAMIKCVVVDKAKFAMGISLDPIETELVEDLIEGIVVRLKAFALDVYHNTIVSMPAENLADYFSQRAHACSSVSSEPRKQVVTTFGEIILNITSDGDRTVVDIEESELLARLSL